MSAEVAEQTQKANKYEEDLTKLLWNKNIKWFLIRFYVKGLL